MEAMAYQLSGTVKKIFETQTFASGFSKRSFVVSTVDKYPQEIQFECLKEKADMLNDLSEGQTVTVHFDISGREWNEKYFVNLNAWKIEQGGGSSANSSADGDSEPEDTTDYSVDNDDNIPF